MHTLLKATALVAILALPSFASAQASVQVTVAAPTIHFEAAPALVEVSPGVQVVPDYGEEVFFVNGWYWCRRDGYWFRTHNYRGGWVMVNRGYVPTRIMRVPPGHYRYHHARPEKIKYREYKESRHGAPQPRYYSPRREAVVVHDRGGGHGGGHGRGHGR